MPTEEEKEDSKLCRRKSFVDRIIDHICTPIYNPSDYPQWGITFNAIGWNRNTIEDFWTLFCRINKSRTGEITIFEFLNYFNLDRSEYVDKCFYYFDTTGGDSIDFLEFMISVWNICTMKVDTLTNFTFDIYDLDSDGELSLPEIERLIIELYGRNNVIDSSMGNEAMQDINKFAEDRGGILTLPAFTMYTMHHSMLLFPVFGIQRIIQKKIMGAKYWHDVENNRSIYFNTARKMKNFDPRHVHILLRTYKTGAAAAILSHTGDPNVALKQQFDLDNECHNEGIKENNDHQKRRESKVINLSKVKNEKFKRAVEKVKEINTGHRSAIRETLISSRVKTFDVAAKAFMAGKKAKTSLATSRLSKLPAKIKTIRNDIRDQLILVPPPPRNSNKEGSMDPSKIQPSMSTELRTGEIIDDKNSNADRPALTSAKSPKSYRRKKPKQRPASAPALQRNKSHLLVQYGSTKLDHRKSTVSKRMRPRTPGSIVYTIEDDGMFSREQHTSNDLKNWFNR